VAKKSQFTYENQAKLSVGLGGLGGLAILGVLALIAKNFHRELPAIIYNPEGKWILVFGLGMLGALVTSAAGLLVGLNSAGQKRNTQTRLSWIGFFVNAGLLTLALIAGLAFYLMRMPTALR
jgi:asparagine N-glycosylation enzyme membrane subunit Stt3